MASIMRTGRSSVDTIAAKGPVSTSRNDVDDLALSARVVDDPGIVRSRWDIVKRVQIRERREFWINQAFFLDEQWVRYDKLRQAVAPPVFRDPNRLRLTVNRIRPNLVTLMARQTARPLTFEVLPDSADDAEVMGARLGEQVLASAHDEQGWEEVRRHELLNSYLGGTSGVLVEWDTGSGTPLGIRTEEGRQVATGDARLTPLGVTEFGLQPGVRRPAEARWCVVGTALPPSQVRDEFNLDWLPAPDAMAEQTLVLLYDSSWRPVADRTLVLRYFERPSAGNQAGCVGIVCNGHWIDGPKPWPFPFKDRLPLAVFRQTYVIGRWTGDSIISSVRPLQVALNHARSNIAEHMRQCGNARLAVPAGSSSMFDSLTDEPGEIFEYNQQLGKAEYISPPELAAWMSEHVKALADEIDTVMGVASTPTSGDNPEAGMSGIALAQLSEKNDTPLGMSAWDQAQGWGDIATMVLELYAANVDAKRTSVVRSANSPVVKKWSGKELHGQTRARVPIDVVLPHSRIAQQSFASELKDKWPEMSLTTFAQIADVPGAEQIQEAIDADVAKTQRVMHQLAQGIVSDECVPQDFDDHAKAIAEGNRFRKSSLYYRLSTEARDDIDAWVQSHETMQARSMGEQRIKAEVHPDLPGLAQADEPPGSGVPMDAVEAQAASRGGVPGAPDQPMGAGAPPGAGAASPPPAPSGGGDMTGGM